MEKVKIDKFDKIVITKFSGDGLGDKEIDDIEEINKFVLLIEEAERMGKMCECFVDTPQLDRFGIKLYKKNKREKKVSLMGPFLRRGEDWYWIGWELKLLEMVNGCTKGISLAMINGAKFVNIG